MKFCLRTLITVSLLFFCQDGVQAEPVGKVFLKDVAHLSVGPLKINHKDGQFDPEVTDKISYPGIFGSNHYLMVGRRNAGFGGSAADFEIRIRAIGRDTFNTILSRRAGTLRIVNHLYVGDDDPIEIPTDGVFIAIDYTKTKKDGTRITGELKRNPDSSTFAKGKLIYQLLAKKKKKFTDAFGNKKETTRYQYLFTLTGKVKNLIVRTTPPDSSDTEIVVKEKAKMGGTFRLTLEKTVTILK